MTAYSKKIDDGGLAFPGVRAEQVGNLSDYGPTDDDAPTFAEVHHPGMSLRDYFAGQSVGASLSMLDRAPMEQYKKMASRRGLKVEKGVMSQLAAIISYEIADAMIAARKAGA